MEIPNIISNCYSAGISVRLFSRDNLKSTMKFLEESKVLWLQETQNIQSLQQTYNIPQQQDLSNILINEENQENQQPNSSHNQTSQVILNEIQRIDDQDNLENQLHSFSYPWIQNMSFTQSTSQQQVLQVSLLKNNKLDITPQKVVTPFGCQQNQEIQINGQVYTQNQYYKNAIVLADATPEAKRQFIKELIEEDFVIGSTGDTTEGFYFIIQFLRNYYYYRFIDIFNSACQFCVQKVWLRITQECSFCYLF
eukprot:TRINITY_DN22148_c0_g1_i1.p1 TRINITY_DN22148_c0_g1~~TRINITY_DN22148_c0_g1_i1.p1  ORF type:complete len:252 (+),score=19.75 TRINITY_DN22148_c0_g1_i1:150-905(+)